MIRQSSQILQYHSHVTVPRKENHNFLVNNFLVVPHRLKCDFVLIAALYFLVLSITVFDFDYLFPLL